MTYLLIGDACLFALYLLFAGIGITWLKVTLAILALLLSGLILGYLYLTKELRKPRSLWMTMAAGAVAVCILVSLILRFPSPKPQEPLQPIAPGSTQETLPTATQQSDAAQQAQ